MVYDNIGAAGLYIFSRAKPTLRQPLSDTRESSEKNSSHIPANRAVIPAKAGIQTFGFQKYLTITVAWTLPTDMVYDNIGAAGLYIFSRAKPTLRQPLSDTRESSEKNSSHIPANRAVIPAKAGIQTFGFQKYLTITVAWTLPTDMVYDNIGAAGLYIFSRAKPTLRQPIADTRKSSEKTHSTSLPATPSFLRRRESRPSAFGNIQ